MRAWNGYAHSIRVKVGGGGSVEPFPHAAGATERNRTADGHEANAITQRTREKWSFPAILFLPCWIGAVVRFSIPRGRTGERSIFFRMKGRGGREKVQPSTVDGFAEVDTLFS